MSGIFRPSPASSSSIQFPDDPSSPTKRKSTRLPLFGRSRKKSTHSDATSDAQPGRASNATNISRMTSGEQPVEARASSSQPSLAHITTPASSSFGSKIVAHLTPSKSRGLHLTHRKSSRKPKSTNNGEDASDYMSDTAPPISTEVRGRVATSGIPTRSTRPGSGGRARRSGSVTPRPQPQLAQPTITVSKPPPDIDDLSEYEDLFTKPRQKSKSKPSPIQILPHSEPEQDNKRGLSPPPSSPLTDLGLSDGSNASSDISTPTPKTPVPISVDYATLSTHSGSMIAADETSSLSREKYRKSLANRTNSSSVRRGLGPVQSTRKQVLAARPSGTDTEMYSAAEESDAMSVMSLPVSSRRSINSLLEYRPLPRIPPAPKTKPPSIPLPATPDGGSRPRAHTLVPLSHNKPPKVGSLAIALKRHSSLSSKSILSASPNGDTPASCSDVTDKQPSSSHSSKSSSSSSSTPTITNTVFSQPLEIDIDSAPVEELRAAFRKRNTQFDDLQIHLQRITENHLQERRRLEKQIAVLERDILRRDKEIKGLNWLVNNNPNPQTLSPRYTTPTPDLDNDDASARSTSTSATRLPTPSPSTRLPIVNRHLNAEDSGAESYQTSGAESNSKSESEPKRTMRKLKLVESFNRNNGSGANNLTKHSSSSSVYSTSSSGGTSPFSSPSPTSMTFSNINPALSSIPESSSLPHFQSQKQRERKLSHSSPPPVPQKTSSTSDTTASARLTPSEAYAKNLKKDRPPSIAQVLTSSSSPPIMEESFGGRSRAILGLVSSKSPR